MQRLSKMAVLTAGVVSLTLSACGGGGDSDEDKIRKIVTDGNSKPTTVCDNISAEIADKFGGKAACKEAAKGEKGDDSTDIKSLKVDGSKATVVANDKDGASTLTLEKTDGKWIVTDIVKDGQSILDA